MPAIWLLSAQFVLALGTQPVTDNCPLPRQLSGSDTHHKKETVEIAHIQDGDTLTLKDGRRVRLLGINTPELGKPGTSPQPFAQQARARVVAFFKADYRAILLTDKQQHDVHGRTLAHVYNLKGQNLEAMLLAQGLGWHVAVPPNLSLAECLAGVEQAARNANLGVWQHEPVSSRAVNSGGFQRIQGRVKNITFADAWWLNLEGNVAAVIYPEFQASFDRNWIKSLQGKTIELQGWVYPSRSKRYQPWRVKLESLYGIELID
jgi:endonuclease YncB( thermonuclease family)